MTTQSELRKTLQVISKAWGRRQNGYAFLPWIDREEQRRTGSRRAGYNEGPAFKWPQDREKILRHMADHQDHDLYWCPSLFEYPHRREDLAMDEHSLWADLDEIDPETIKDYRPSIAWESSPGRYQALWLAASGDFQGASWPGNENQRLTYYVGADRSGWDTTQLLRVPGWVNHKLDYEQDGHSPIGKLLWVDGPQYHPGDFSDLPEINGLTGGLTDALELEIESVDRHKVLAGVKLKLTRRIRDLISSRTASGDRSDALWEMERGLADAGCSVAEIVAIVRETVWNKYAGRADEMKRLILEASKAISAKPETVVLEEDEIERTAPQRFGDLLKNVKRPKFLIEGILTEGACGFIAGEPKCYKSWIGLDMALAVASGANFLDHFRVINPGPVLYIQEEDPLPTLKVRTAKIWANQATDKLVLGPSEGFPEIEWLPPEVSEVFDPDINAYIQRGFTVSDEAWQLWLDETIAEGMNGEPYRLLIIDTLMMVAGDVEENKSQAMTQKIFKPLKVLSRKYNIAVQVVHHMGKAERPRAGQRMLGAVANHAWAEDSLYLGRATNGDIKMELESKTAPANLWRITNLNNTVWEPQVGAWSTPKQDGVEISQSRSSRTRGRARSTNSYAAVEWLKLRPGEQFTTKQISEGLANLSRPQAWRQLRKAEEQGLVIRTTGSNNTDQWRVA